MGSNPVVDKNLRLNHLIDMAKSIDKTTDRVPSEYCNKVGSCFITICEADVQSTSTSHTLIESVYTSHQRKGRLLQIKFSA